MVIQLPTTPVEVLEIVLDWSVTKELALEQLSVINHLTNAAVAKPSSTALLNHVHLLPALTIPEQDVSMSSVKDAAVYLGSLCGIQKLLTSVMMLILKAKHYNCISINVYAYIMCIYH